jgi:serine/threonine protein kinase
VLLYSKSHCYQVDPYPLSESEGKGWALFRGTFLDHRRHSKSVVIKIGFNSTSVRRIFIREVEQTQHYRLCECERLVTPIDSQLSEVASCVFLVFPDRGLDASDFITHRARDLQPFDEKVIAVILSDVLEGLNFLRRHGLSHRDVKLENICISGNRGFLIDLEMVRPIGWKYRGSEGTIGYLPEELNDCSEHVVSEANDVFALAIAALQLFAGKCLEWHPDFGFDRPGDLLVVIHEKLQDCMSRALDQNPAVRPTLTEFAEALALIGPEVNDQE